MYELGIFGGTFSPVHTGHIQAAHTFLEVLALDKLLVVPTFCPPHKEVSEKDDPYARLHMLHLAFEDDPDYKNGRIGISDYEISKGGKSYTSDTLEHFSDDRTSLTFICGSDMFLTMDRWNRPEVIFSLSRIAYTLRGVEDAVLENECRRTADRYREIYGADIVKVDMPPIPVSSTEIRDSIRVGKDISGYIPEKVSEYIKQNNMYRG